MPSDRRVAGRPLRLISTVAGQKATFNVECFDVLGQAAATASVFVYINGPVAISPTVTAVQGAPGNYRCTYTAGIIGAYQLEIWVGRGGASRRQLIPSGQYLLTVQSGPTATAVSTSEGTFLSLSTAGVVGSFTVLARDVLGNRRPGNDQIDVLIFSANDKSALEKAGLVSLPKSPVYSRANMTLYFTKQIAQLIKCTKFSK